MEWSRVIRRSCLMSRVLLQAWPSLFQASGAPLLFMRGSLFNHKKYINKQQICRRDRQVSWILVSHSLAVLIPSPHKGARWSTMRKRGLGRCFSGSPDQQTSAAPGNLEEIKLPGPCGIDDPELGARNLMQQALQVTFLGKLKRGACSGRSGISEFPSSP